MAGVELLGPGLGCDSCCHVIEVSLPLLPLSDEKHLCLHLGHYVAK
jgi:hypothetical protein